MVIMMENKFLKIQEKYKRGVYKKIGLLAEEEKEKDFFKIESWQEKELLEECEKYMDSDSVEMFQEHNHSLESILN